jgi:hypothetical protein
VGFKSQAHDLGIALRKGLSNLRNRHGTMKRLIQCESLVAPQNKGNLPNADRIATLMALGMRFGAGFRITAAMNLTLICFVDRG